MTITSIFPTPFGYNSYKRVIKNAGEKTISYLAKSNDSKYNKYIKISPDLGPIKSGKLEKLKAMMGNYAKKNGLYFSFNSFDGVGSERLLIVGSNMKKIKQCLSSGLIKEEEPVFARKIYAELGKLIQQANDESTPTTVEHSRKTIKGIIDRVTAKSR